MKIEFSSQREMLLFLTMAAVTSSANYSWSFSRAANLLWMSFDHFYGVEKINSKENVAATK